MYENILHATDLREENFALCERAVNIARYFNAKIYLLHVIEPPVTLQIAQGLGFAEFDRPTDVQSDAMALMKVLGEALNLQENQLAVEIGSIKAQVINYIVKLNCNLVVIGANTNITHFLTNPEHDITAHAPCDVMILR